MLFSMLSVAWALDPGAPAPAPPPSDHPEPHVPRTEIDFPPVSLAGQKLGPGMIMVGGRPRAVFPPIFELRRDWDQELRWSVDEIE